MPVNDVVLPGNSSVGRICYVPFAITEQVPGGFRGVDYRANASYTSVAELPATIQVYGRTTPPEAPCVLPGAADTPLSGPITLIPGTTQEVLLGGPGYGGALAALIVEPSYYLGASITGGVVFSTEERISLTDGEVSVYY